MLAPGAIVADRYRLERVIGRGGMGMVIAATHVQLGSPVALKFLNRNVIGNESLTERFLREARATAALRSEHICRVFDVGTFEGVPYLVMELLEGTDLHKMLRQRNTLPISEACDYLLQACVGIADAHAAHIVHRDLKPGNLFLTTRSDGSPLVKVLDFGVAKAPAEVDNALTQTDTVLGSPLYMSLEQLRSSKLVDLRSDIWSLGVILFEMISGRRPYGGEGIADIALKIALEPTPPLFATPHPLDGVIARCLEKDPARRFQSVADLTASLMPFATDHGRALVPSLSRASWTPAATSSPSLPGPVSAPALPPANAALTTLQSATGAVEAAPRRSRTIMAASVGVAIAIGVTLGVAVTRGDGGGTPSPRPAAVVDKPPPPLAIDAGVAREPAPDAAVVTAPSEPAPAAKPAVKPKPKRRRPARRPDDFTKSRI